MTDYATVEIDTNAHTIEINYGGVQGSPGVGAYLYRAWASDASGTGFTTTFNAALNYIAFKSTTTPITSPSASDFTGLWFNYKGATGANGSLAWCDDWASDHGTYYVNNFVYHAVTDYGKGLFRCIVEHDPSVAATEPVTGGSAATYWETSVQGGADGADGADGEGTGDFLADGSVPMTASIDLTDITTPDAPASGHTRLYSKSATMCYRANGGAETVIQPKVDYMIAFCLSLGGAVLTTGVYPGLPVPAAGTITAARAISNDSTSGSIAVDLWLEPYADAPPADADSITASAPVTITTATKSEDTTLTGWSKSLAVGDFIVPNIDSVTSLKNVTVYLTVARS